MPKQNIFDNETFFEGYRQIRERESNANDLFEIPVLFGMLPDLTGKEVLDLGCGFGEHCSSYIKKGAAAVTGICSTSRIFSSSARGGRRSIPEGAFSPIVKRAQEDMPEKAGAGSHRKSL
ncbi:MAG: hypothetical protein K5891_03595 [Lachnospiraceae bacterium]|nr:hypothetical protein [Lachnospiraceae bacterium]